MNRRRRLPDPHDVLAGRAPARLEELFELVHAVNPTERGLAGRELAEAYALKARLQSLLIERFGEQLVIDEVPGSGEVIGLRHRVVAKDACHAVVQELSAAARAWVRLQRDLGPAAADASRDAKPAPRRAPRPAGGTSSTAASQSAADLLDRGRSALAEYDYQAAQDLFAAAIARSREAGDTATTVLAIRAMLQVLVDHLVDDAAALSLRTGLPDEAVHDAECLFFLALAASRQGDQALATSLLGDSGHERAPEVVLELAKAALASARTEDCARLLARIPSGSPQHSDALQLADALRRRRAEAARPLEERLTEALARGEQDAVELITRQLLEVHPDSEVARAAIARSRRVRDEAKARELGDALADALHRGDAATARAVLRDMQDRHVDSAAWAAKVVALEQQLEVQRTAVAIGTLKDQLRGGLDGEAVEAWWAATEPVRHAARELIADPSVDWLHEIGRERSLRHPAVAAAAALALVRVEASLAAADPLAADEELMVHEDLALACARGRALHRRVRAAAAKARAEAAARRLAEAEALASERHGTARERFESIAAAELDPALVERHAALGQRLLRQERLAELEQRFAAGQACGDLLASREAAAQLAEEAEPTEAGLWRERVLASSAQIRSVWVEADLGSGEPPHDLLSGPRAEEPLGCAAVDGERMVVAEALGSRIFVRVVHLDLSRSRTIVLHPPEPLGLVSVLLRDTSLWLLGGLGVACFDLASLDLLRLVRHRDVGLTGFVNAAALAADGRFLWLRHHTHGRQEVVVVDLHRKAIHRRLETVVGLFCPILGMAPSLVALSRNYTDLALVDERGKTVHADESECIFHTAVAHPSGAGLLVFRSDPRTASAGSGAMLLAQSMRDDGPVGDPVEIGIVSPDGLLSAATSLDQGCTFLICSLMPGGRHCIAMRWHGARLIEAWRVPVPHRLLLGADESSRHVLALRNDGESISLQRLTDCAIRPSKQPVLAALPSLDPFRVCEWQSIPVRERIAVYQAVLLVADRAQVRRRALDVVAEETDLEVLLGLYGCALDTALDERIAQRLEVDHPEEPVVRMLLADRRIHDGDYAAALASLDRIDPAKLDRRMAQHLAHQLAVCHVALGDDQKAKAAVATAVKAAAAACNIESLDSLVDCLGAPLSRLRGATGAVMQNLIGRVRRADEALTQDDGDSAREHLEHPSVWCHRHPQVLSRLAASFLLAEDGDQAFLVRKRRVLAAFLAAMALRDASAGVLFGSISWPLGRLMDLAARAETWLQRHGTIGPERVAGDTGQIREESQRRLVLTKFTVGGTATSYGQVLPDADIVPVLRPHVRGLLASTRAALAVTCLPPSQVVAFVLMPGTDGYDYYRSACEHLLGLEVDNDEIAMPMSINGAFDVLRKWPYVFDRFEAFHKGSVLRGHLTFVLVRGHGAGFKSLAWDVKAWPSD